MSQDVSRVRKRDPCLLPPSLCLAETAEGPEAGANVCAPHTDFAWTLCNFRRCHETHRSDESVPAG